MARQLVSLSSDRVTGARLNRYSMHNNAALEFGTGRSFAMKTGTVAILILLLTGGALAVAN